MVTITIEINTFEEALNLQNIAAIKSNNILKGKAKGLSTEQVLISLMWKQVYFEASHAMERLRARKKSCSDCLDEAQ